MHGVGHGVVDVAYGFVGEFLARIALVFLGDVLLSADVPLLQVRPDVGYLRSAVLCVVACLCGVNLDEGRQVLLRMPEGMEHIPRAVGVRLSLS